MDSRLINSLCFVVTMMLVDWSNFASAATPPFEAIHGNIDIQALAGRIRNDVESYLGQTGSCYDLSKYSTVLSDRGVMKCAYGSDVALKSWGDGQNSEYITPSLGPEFGIYIEIYFEHGIAEEIRFYNIESEFRNSALLEVGITWLGRPQQEDGSGYYWVGDRRIHLASVFYTPDPRGSFVEIFAKVHKGQPLGLPWSLCGSGRLTRQKSWCSLLSE
ncbi:MAG: hypothetical protein U1E52_09995 [Geminicoccaceae bacterium]